MLTLNILCDGWFETYVNGGTMATRKIDRRYCSVGKI